jgi:hypothetical protein
MIDRYQRFEGTCRLRLQDRGVSQKDRAGLGKFLLALASQVILGSESRGTHYHTSRSLDSGILTPLYPPRGGGVLH